MLHRVIKIVLNFARSALITDLSAHITAKYASAVSRRWITTVCLSTTASALTT